MSRPRKIGVGGVSAGLVLLGALLWPSQGLGLGRADRAGPPDWVSGASAEYPEEKYLSGVGFGKSRKQAEDRAYAAIARIFQADVSSRVEEWEEFLQRSDAESQSRRRVRIDQLTRVSTEKVLENVSIAQVWTDPASGDIYALALMDRSKSARVLRARIEALDDEARLLLAAAREEGDGGADLETVRRLYGALKTLLLREGLNRDLTIVHPTSGGMASPLSPAEVGQRLKRALASDFFVGLEVEGPHAREVRSALQAGLTREGLSVAEAGPAEADVSIKAVVRTEALELQGRPFYRWRVQVEVVDQQGGRLVGGLVREGREGHLYQDEARGRAIRSARDVMEREVAPLLADLILDADFQKERGVP